MGTNYYHRPNTCPECGHYEERQIGKNSGGWEFSFRGYKTTEGEPVIVSWRLWKEVLKEGKIFDEYGQEHSYDDFVLIVENTKEPGHLNHYDETAKHYRHCYNDFDSENWKDSEGWSFSSAEFC